MKNQTEFLEHVSEVYRQVRNLSDDMFEMSLRYLKAAKASALSFERGVVYSYQLPICVPYINKETGKKAMLIYADRYSQTTSKHRNRVRGLFRHFGGYDITLVAHELIKDSLQKSLTAEACMKELASLPLKDRGVYVQRVLQTIPQEAPNPLNELADELLNST